MTEAKILPEDYRTRVPVVIKIGLERVDDPDVGDPRVVRIRLQSADKTEVLTELVLGIESTLGVTARRSCANFDDFYARLGDVVLPSPGIIVEVTSADFLIYQNVSLFAQLLETWQELAALHERVFVLVLVVSSLK
jgi:hypothetical protein